MAQPLRGRVVLRRMVVGASIVAASMTCAIDVYSGPPPLDAPRAAPTPADQPPPSTGNARLRVPSRTNLDRVVTIRGVSQTLRAHLDQINPNESRTLKNGK